MYERSRRSSLVLFGLVALLWPVVTWATLVASPGKLKVEQTGVRTVPDRSAP